MVVASTGLPRATVVYPGYSIAIPAALGRSYFPATFRILGSRFRVAPLWKVLLITEADCYYLEFVIGVSD